MSKESITVSLKIKYKIFPNYSLNYKMWQTIELLTFQKDTSNGTALDQRFLPHKANVLEGVPLNQRNQEGIYALICK